VNEEEAALEARMTSSERGLFENQRKRIGVETNPRSPHTIWYCAGASEPVSVSKIQRWATINEDFNPLWFDAEYGGKSVWNGVVAPPMFLLALDDGVWPGAQPASEIYKPGVNCVVDRERFPNFRGSMQTTSDWEFFEPVRPGDQIEVKGKATDLYWKQGKRYRLLFSLGEIRFRNQHQRTVAINRSGVVFMFK